MTEPNPDDRITRVWWDNHAYLVDLAFRMLGDIGEAEDIVQESFTRLAATTADQIDTERGWLTVVTSRLCLDQLRSARARRERTDEAAVHNASGPLGAQPSIDPADRITLDDEVRAALDIALGRLNPAERVAFILHDVFATPFDTIARTLGKPVGTCRQLARRARRKIATASDRPDDRVAPEHRVVTQTFIHACATGDLDALITVLHSDVWGVAEFIGSESAPRRVNHGAQTVAHTLMRFFGPGTTLVSLPTAGDPVLRAYRHYTAYATTTLTIEDNRIRQVHVTLFPGPPATGTGEPD